MKGGRRFSFTALVVMLATSDPATGSVTKLAKTTVSRGLHGTATLLPDASVFFAGENREALVQPDDPSFPLMSSYAGLLPRGDPDQGVPPTFAAVYALGATAGGCAFDNNRRHRQNSIPLIFGD